LSDILPAIGLLADALRYAHGKGVVHRDVKASNVLLDYNGVPYLSDFGVSAAAGQPAAGGTPAAASPQVARREPAQPSDDIYALGVLIHELITGAPPGEGPLVTRDGEASQPGVADLLARMLDKDASERPDAQGVIDALTQAGYRPGPARSQIRARPVAADERIESIAAVSRQQAAPVSADPQAPTPGINPRIVSIGLAALVIALLGVVFLLPDAVEEDHRAGPANMAPVAGGSSAVDPIEGDVVDDDAGLGANQVTREYVPENRGLEGESIDFNENEADYSGLDEEGKLRFQVEGVLGELLSNFETLKRRGVERWAPVPYKRAQALYAEGDDAYLRKDWATAEIRYLDALSILEPLFDQVDEEFRAALEGARAAFEAGDRAEALRLYELAVAITPNDPEAVTGYERARNLEAVLRLVEQGLDYEEDLELDAAETSFKQAAELDPQWVPAQEGLERVRAMRLKMQFDARMSEGLEALAVGDYLSARAAFRMAQQLMPGSPEPADGLMQVDQGLKLQSIVTLEQEAQVLEESEHWAGAATTYEEILEVDPNLAFAIEGLAKARSMTALHQRFDEYIADPDRLSTPSVMQEATRLVIDVTTMDDVGPRLVEQRDELSRLLKRAATPIPVQLVSDNLTSVSIYKVGALGAFTSRSLELRPGTYVAVGARPGYRDVRLEFRVAPEIDMQPVIVRCEEPI
jgi:tetratricopeptide (TPR) repeat protein